MLVRASKRALGRMARHGLPDAAWHSYDEPIYVVVTGREFHRQDWLRHAELWWLGM
jgi:hypothetical protein